MAEALEWSRDTECLVLRGNLEHETLFSLWNARERAVEGITHIDISALNRVDTAGLALILHLCALVSARKKSVNIVGMSDNVATLAQLYNLPEHLLPVSRV